MLEPSIVCDDCFSGDETTTLFLHSFDELFRIANPFSGVIGEVDLSSEHDFVSSGSVMAKETFASMDSASPVFFLSSLVVLAIVSSSSVFEVETVVSP
jgi:hypothetical protein